MRDSCQELNALNICNCKNFSLLPNKWMQPCNLQTCLNKYKNIVISITKIIN